MALVQVLVAGLVPSRPETGFTLVLFLSVVFLNSQLASQVLVRNRRANQIFEEMKPGKTSRSRHRHPDSNRDPLKWPVSPQGTWRGSVWRKSATTKKPERFSSRRIKPYEFTFSLSFVKRSEIRSKSNHRTNSVPFRKPSGRHTWVSRVRSDWIGSTSRN